MNPLKETAEPEAGIDASSDGDGGRYTEDAILSGKIAVLQPKNGYRFSLDAVLLAFFVRAKKSDTIVDLGCGSGVIGLILAHRFPDVCVYGLELQRELAEAAAQNAMRNGFSDRVKVIQRDFTTLPCPGLPGKIDAVVSNPPFRKSGSGRPNPLSPKAIARHEIAGSLAQAAEAASRLLSPKGSFFCVYPASRLAHCISTLCANGLEPKRLRAVHPKKDEPASLILVEARKGGGPELLLEPPLFIHENGGYTEEISAMLGLDG